MQSGGRISKITVDRSLGAASVGQALLCTMELADGSSREVVVKLLRPDAKARAEREAAIFREAANSVSGMGVTFEGQLSRIMEELDLTIEARHIGEGRIYDLSARDNGTQPISSMKIDSLVPPTPNTLVLQKAPGKTIDKYVQSVTDTIESELG